MLAYSNCNKDTGITTIELIEFDNEQILKSKIKFKELQEKNIVIKGDFEDNEWTLTNQVYKHTFKFKFDEILYKKESKKRSMYTFEEFVDSIKSYIILNIESKAISNLHYQMHTFKKYLHATKFFNQKYSKKGLEVLSNITDGIVPFIRMYTEYVTFEGTEHYFSIMDELMEYAATIRASSNSENDNRRILADFQSILMFNDIIEGFWQVINNDSLLELKELYYPLYLWWKITNIIPLRVTEFCVTPYDCIEDMDDGKFYIFLRRSSIKGRHDKQEICHNIDQDYKIYKYNIPKEIANLIEEYKEITSKTRVNFDRLICYATYNIKVHPHRINPDTSKKSYNYAFSRHSLTNLLKKFFIEIVHGKLNYDVLCSMDFINQRIVGIENDKNTAILEFKPLKDNQISIFKPGDIRHYAMINLVLNDVNPILVRELVSHEDINTSYHYFGNTAEVVKCMSYIKYREICKKEYDKTGKNKGVVTTDRIFNQLESKQSVEVDNGRCISKSFMAGKLDSCILVDLNCEICNFFIQEKTPDKETQKAKLKILEEKIERESELIADILRSYKNTPKKNKDLTLNTLKLENSIQLYCDESLKNGGIIW